jgi:hypothetical protein
VKCLEKTGGNKRQAAKLLNLSRTTFIDKLQRLTPTNRRRTECVRTRTLIGRQESESETGVRRDRRKASPEVRRKEIEDRR